MRIALAPSEFYPVEIFEHLDREVAPDPAAVAERRRGDRAARARLGLGDFLESVQRGGQEEARPISIVGISQVGGQFLQQSIEEKQPVVILNFMAVISIALGFTNLLPIPALDGGRILFVLIEIVRGRPIAPEREGMVHLVGMVVLLSIGLIIMLYDLFNPFVIPPQ